MPVLRYSFMLKSNQNTLWHCAHSGTLVFNWKLTVATTDKQMSSPYPWRSVVLPATLFVPSLGLSAQELTGVSGPINSHNPFPSSFAFTIAVLVLFALLLMWVRIRVVIRQLEPISAAMKRFVTNGFQEYSIIYPDSRSEPLLRWLQSMPASKAVLALAVNADVMASAIAESKRAMLEREKEHLQWIEFLSHDLALPLARISKRLDVLEYGPKVTEEQQARHYDLAQREITQLVETLGSISQFASLEGGAERHFVEVSLEPLLQNAIDVYEFDACQKGIKVQRQLDVDLLVRVEKTLIRRALENLISNAVRYTPEGGHISVHAERFDRTVEIRVRDSGIGIPQDELPRIFDFAFRGNRQSRPAKFGSRGLGLALVQKVAEMHHGEVKATNIEPRGSEFVLTLPIED